MDSRPTAAAFNRLPGTAALGHMASPASSCRVWSQGDFFARAHTFTAQKWFGKPSMISGLNCARYGWVCKDVDTLSCEICSACVFYQATHSRSKDAVDEVNRAFHARMTSGHEGGCPWKGASCSEEFARVPHSAPMLLNDFLERLSSWNGAWSIEVDTTAAAAAATAAGVRRQRSRQQSGEEKMSDVSSPIRGGGGNGGGNQLVTTTGKSFLVLDTDTVRRWVDKLRELVGEDKSVLEIPILSSIIMACCGWSVNEKGELAVAHCSMCNARLPLKRFMLTDKNEIQILPSRKRRRERDEPSSADNAMTDEDEDDQTSSSSSSSYTIASLSSSRRRNNAPSPLSFLGSSSSGLSSTSSSNASGARRNAAAADRPSKRQKALEPTAFTRPVDRPDISVFCNSLTQSALDSGGAFGLSFGQQLGGGDFGTGAGGGGTGSLFSQRPSSPAPDALYFDPNATSTRCFSRPSHGGTPTPSPRAAQPLSQRRAMTFEPVRRHGGKRKTPMQSHRDAYREEKQDAHRRQVRQRRQAPMQTGKKRSRVNDGENDVEAMQAAAMRSPTAFSALRMRDANTAAGGGGMAFSSNEQKSSLAKGVAAASTSSSSASSSSSSRPRGRKRRGRDDDGEEQGQGGGAAARTRVDLHSPNVKRARSEPAKPFNPLREHRLNCPWVAGPNAPGRQEPGWSQCLSSIVELYTGAQQTNPATMSRMQQLLLEATGQVGPQPPAIGVTAYRQQPLQLQPLRSPVVGLGGQQQPAAPAPPMSLLSSSSSSSPHFGSGGSVGSGQQQQQPSPSSSSAPSSQFGSGQQQRSTQFGSGRPFGSGGGSGGCR